MPLQQPLGHELAVQPHAPALEQVCPVPQDLQAAPPVPQVELDRVLH